MVFLELILHMEFVELKVWIFKGEKFDKDVNDIQKDKPSNDELKKVEE